METNVKIKGIKALLTVLMISLSFFGKTQYCDSLVPTFNVDLSSNPNASWVSPLVSRNGNCCGTSNPDKCLEFVITLNPSAIAVSFNIASGAVPPGALFYQIDCGPVTPVGSPICLIGPGPFTLTFCKPGNNSNTFSITSYSEPIIGPDITVNSGCSGDIYAQYYNEPSMTWTSIFPGATGAYDYLLGCTSGCDTTSFTANGNLPAYIDYLVCGTDIAGCNPLPYCDTIRVTINPPHTVTIDPDSAHLCFGAAPIPLNTTVTGGAGPFTFLWSTGAITPSINAGAGVFIVEVFDITGCMIATDTSIITQDLLPIAANAGPDQLFCNQSIPNVQLSGIIQTAAGGIWSGGAGVFVPNNTDLNAQYTPTPAEIASGSVILTLSSTSNNGCTPDSDQMTISFSGFNANLSLSTNDITCNGANDGSASVTGAAGLQFSWDGGALVPDTFALNLTPGAHDVQILDELGCDTTINFMISEPSILTTSIDFTVDLLCNGTPTGSAQVTANGGTPGYNYSWNSVPVQNSNLMTGVPAGNYSCTITDANGCVDFVNVQINEPAVLNVNLSVVPPSCNGYNNGSISTNVAGGVGPYSYSWSTGAISSNLYNVSAGNYSVIVTDTNGCVNQQFAFVNEPALLTGMITNDTVICLGSNLDLSVNIQGGSGNYGCVWTPGGQNTATIQVSPASDQSYSCLITDNNGCQINFSVNVQIEVLNADDLVASATAGSMCLGDSVGLSAQYLGNDPSVIMQWIHCPTCSTSSTIYDTPAFSAQYVLQASNYCGQFVYDTVTVFVNQPPVLVVSPNSAAICPGESLLFVNNGQNDPSWSYFWEFGDGFTSTMMNPTHNYPSHGNYMVSLTVTDDNGCTAQAINAAFVTVFPQAQAIFNVDNTEVSSLDPVVNFSNYSINANTFIWSFGDGNGSIQANPSYEYDEAGYYTVTLYASNPFGCMDSTFITIHVKPDFDIFVPNTFTPDGDNHNNTFYAKGYGISEKGFTLQIYNRWGDLVFESHDMDAHWDGIINTEGNQRYAQDGTYTWVIFYQDLEEKRHRAEGHVNLLK